MRYYHVMLQLGNMRKPQDFLVSLSTADQFYLQSDKSIAKVTQKGIGIINTNGTSFAHLYDETHVYPVKLSQEQLVELNRSFILEGDGIGGKRSPVKFGKSDMGVNTNDPVSLLKSDFQLAVSHFRAAALNAGAAYPLEKGQLVTFKDGERYRPAKIDVVGSKKVTVETSTGVRVLDKKNVFLADPAELMAYSHIQAAKLYELPQQTIWIAPSNDTFSSVGLPYRLTDKMPKPLFKHEDKVKDATVVEYGGNDFGLYTGQYEHLYWLVSYENGILSAVEAC